MDSVSTNYCIEKQMQNEMIGEEIYEHLPLLARLFRKRILFLKLTGLSVLFLLLCSSSRWPESGAVESLMLIVGYVFVTIAVFGRLWSGLYICGHKGKTLITDGPYSVVRNPLYLFSMLGYVGVGLVSESFIVALLLLALFFISHVPTVQREEAELEARFGAEFQTYRAEVPFLIPRHLHYRPAETRAVSVAKFERNFLDAIWFLWIPIVLELIEALHHSGYLPVLLRLP